MAQGMPYDSDEGRAWAARDHRADDRPRVRDERAHRGAHGPVRGLRREPRADAQRAAHAPRRGGQDRRGRSCRRSCSCAAQQSWDEAVELGERHGVRNSQASVLAPTGTIGLMMDCDTTGIEPDLALTKAKKLVGGGTMFIVNQTVPRALRKLGYTDDEVDAIVAYIDEHKTIIGAPAFKAEHLPVFACSMGDNTIHYMGHVKMMAAVQPFISGAITKTVNMPEDVTVEEVEDALHRVVAARPEGGRALPRQLQGRPAARDAEEGGRPTTRSTQRGRAHRRDRHRAGAGPAEAAADAHGEDVLVPGRRLPRLRDGRRVRGRPSRRAVPQGGEAGLDARRHHGRVRDLGEPRPAVRRAARGVRRDVHEHALRARGHDRRPRHPVRDRASSTTSSAGWRSSTCRSTSARRSAS